MSSPDDSLDSNMPKTGTVPHNSVNIKSTLRFADPIANFAASFASSQRIGQDINTGIPPAMSPSSTETPHNSLAPASDRAISQDEPSPGTRQNWRINQGVGINTYERHSRLETDPKPRTMMEESRLEQALLETQNEGGSAQIARAGHIPAKRRSSNYPDEPRKPRKTTKEQKKAAKKAKGREERMARAAKTNAKVNVRPRRERARRRKMERRRRGIGLVLT